MGLNEEITIMCAIRYAMGRQSYAVSSVIEHVYDCRKRFSETQRQNLIDLLAREVQEEEKLDTHFAYREDWEELIQQLKDLIIN